MPVAQMKKALKALNLTIRKFHAPKFTFVEENVEEPQTEVVQEFSTNAPIQARAAEEMEQGNVDPNQNTTQNQNW